jgi:hypothetical protein
VIVFAALDTLEGILGVCADKEMLSSLTMNMQEGPMHGMKFCCEGAIKTVEVIAKNLIFTESITGQTTMYELISVDCHLMQVCKTLGNNKEKNKQAVESYGVVTCCGSHTV